VAREIGWASTGDGEFPYQARLDGRRLTIRVNDFPAEPLYTLLVDGRAAVDLEDWPAAWVRPGSSADRLRIGGEVFQVSTVEPQEDSPNIRLELQGHDGGSVTLIGLRKTRVETG